MAGTPASSRHRSAAVVSVFDQSTARERHLHNHDCYEEARENEEYANCVQMWHRTIEETYAKTCDPCCDQIGHKNMPWLGDKVGMRDSPHLNDGVG